VLFRIYFDFIHHLFNVLNAFGKLLSFSLLSYRLYGSLQNQRSVLGRAVDALIVEARVLFQRSLEVIFDRAVAIGCRRPGAATPISSAMV